MKKVIALLLLVCLLPLCALSEMDEDGDVVVTLDGAEFFFTPIEDGHLLTRESSASAFNRLGMSQRETIPLMEQQSMYALMFDADFSCEVHVYAFATELADFLDMSDYGMTAQCSYYETFMTDYGYTVDAVEEYLAPEGHRFVRTMMQFADESSGAFHMLEYHTCHGGVQVTIALVPYAGAITPECLALGETIADSLWIKATE